MSQAFFIVYDAATGDIKRHGKCPREHLESQARPSKGEAVMEDEPRSINEARTMIQEQRITKPAKGSPYLRKRAAAEIAARKRKQLSAQPGIDQLLAVLNEKLGVKITRADLEAVKLKDRI